MSSPSLILPPGATLGGFEIEDVLGVGGMAVVYRAVQLSLGRRVALKVLNPRLAADLTFRERFRREGALVAALDHPNVIPVYDFGEADGRLYLAMRLVDGVTLADRMLDAPLSPIEAVDVVRHVASALDAAHDAGLLHRDVKPQNILLSHGGAVYLADFGVAKMAGSPDLTHTGGFLGSVTYVSPEHIRGEAVGPPADVYALATVAYECLAGRVPFRRDTEASVIHAHLSDPPPALPGDDPSSAGVSRALLDALAKDPGERTASAGAFAADLAAAVDGLETDVQLRRPGFGSREPVDELDVLPASSTVVIGAPPADTLPRPGAPSPTPPAPTPAPTPAPRPLPTPTIVPEPVPDALPVPVPGGAPAPRSEHTVHDRRRDELVRGDSGGRSKADLAFKVIPVLLVVIAVALPFAVLSATKKDPVTTQTVGQVKLVGVPGWASQPVEKVAPAQAFGLSLGAGRRWTSPDGTARITTAALSSGSRLSPTGLGDAETVTQVKVPGGVVRRWSIADPTVKPAAAAGGADVPTTPTTPAAVTTDAEPAPDPMRSVAVALGEKGPFAVVCAGPPEKVRVPCEALLVSMAATDGKFTSDPDGKLGDTLAKAVASAERTRSNTLLPSKDRTVRARRAKALGRAYAASGKALDAGVTARPWDTDLKAARSALVATSTAYLRIASAAGGKDKARDAAARKSLAAADDRLKEAIGRLGRRGYVVRS